MTGSRVAPGFGISFVQNDRTRFLVDILKLARDDGLGEVAFLGEIPNTICAGDDGSPGRAWLRYLIRSKMIVLGFMLLFSSLPGMTGLGEVAFLGEIPNTICAGDDGIPGRAWLRYFIRSKMIVLGFMLLFSSLPGMTGLGDSVFFSERFQRIVFFQCFQVRRPERTWGLLVAGYWLPVTGCRGL